MGYDRKLYTNAKNEAIKKAINYNLSDILINILSDIIDKQKLFFRKKYHKDFCYNWFSSQKLNFNLFYDNGFLILDSKKYKESFNFCHKFDKIKDLLYKLPSSTITNKTILNFSYGCDFDINNYATITSITNILEEIINKLHSSIKGNFNDFIL
jgi:hypothetical protein